MSESPNGSTIPLVDSAGVKWTLVAGQVAKNGVIDTSTANAILLLYWNHFIYHQNSTGGWWSWANNAWVGTVDPRPITNAESTQGTTLTSVTGVIYDAGLLKWTLVSSTSSGLQIAKNGATDTVTANVTLLLYWNHMVYQQNSAGGWWNWANSAWNSSSDPRTTPVTNANVTVNLAAPTGKTLAASIYGFCGGGLCYGTNRANDFSTVFDPKFQTSAAKLKPALIRFNAQQTQPMLEHVFRNGVNNPDWTWLDNWINNHAGFFNGRLVFGIGPMFSDTSHTAQVYASWAIAVATHLKLAGQECMWWEIGNEPDGSGGLGTQNYVNYFNAIADALHGVNPNYKCGGPVTSYWGSGGYNTAWFSGSKSRIGFVVWHSYGFSGTATPSSAQIYAQAISYGSSISSVRSQCNAAGLTNVPLAMGEYNMLLDGGNNSTLQAALFSALYMTGAFKADPNFQMGAVWDLVGPNGGFSCVGNSYQGDNSFIDPQGWYLGMAGQKMSGSEVAVSTTLSNVQIVATKNGKAWAVQIINYATSGSQTVNLGLSGGTLSGPATKWLLSPVALNGSTTTLTSLSNIVCPAESVTILTGTTS